MSSPALNLLSKGGRGERLVYSEVHVKSHGSFFTNSWIKERLVQHSCLPSPCMTETRSPGLTHLCDLEHLLAGRWSWPSKPMPSWHRSFSWLLCLTGDLVPPAIRFWKGPDICQILETPLFVRNFISQLFGRGKNRKKWGGKVIFGPSSIFCLVAVGPAIPATVAAATTTAAAEATTTKVDLL